MFSEGGSGISRYLDPLLLFPFSGDFTRSLFKYLFTTYRQPLTVLGDDNRNPLALGFDKIRWFMYPTFVHGDSSRSSEGSGDDEGYESS
jgi:hypothetical protein